MLDPSLTEDSREMKLDAHRTMSEELLARRRRRFPARRAPVVGRFEPYLATKITAPIQCVGGDRMSSLESVRTSFASAAG
jgi:hypothetical protein